MDGTRSAGSRGFVGALALVLTLALILLTPVALAHHKSGHGRGGGAKTVESDDQPDAGDNEHPSGKDKSVEPGTAGNSGSDPDDDGRGPDRSNGGPDKPGGSGGVDQGDQDGNNGCGNDDDFEDDNEGWCGSKPKPDVPSNVGIGVGGGPGLGKGPGARDTGEVVLSEVQGKRVLRDRAPAGSAPLVLGTRMAIAPSGQGSALPFTGAPLWLLVAVGLTLVTAGGLLVLQARPARIH